MKKVDVIRCSAEAVRKLRDTTGYTVGLAVLTRDHNEGVVISEFTGKHGLSFHLNINFHFPLYCNAPGKAFLAHLSEKELTKILSHIKLKRLTPTTITSTVKLRAELSEIRRTGYAVDRAEQLEGCHCVAASVLDEKGFPVAAVWITAPTGQLPEHDFVRQSKHVIECANTISSNLNASPDYSSYHSYIVENAIGIMKQNIDSMLDMEALAAQLHVGYSWFRRIFKRLTGTSPNQYFMDLKLNEAKKMLAEGMSVREVSDSLGYQTQEYFSSIFKKKTGKPPSAFRGS